MPFINCKVELKLRWTKQFVLALAGVENDNAHSNNLIFTIKDTKLYVPVVIASGKDNQNYQNLLAKDLKDQFIRTNVKRKYKNKNTTNEHRYFLESRLFVLIYFNRDNDVKEFKAQIYLPKAIIKNSDVTINGKNFYDQPIDSDIKRYIEIRKATTGLGEDSTVGYLLDYEYIRNHFTLKAVDLNRQKELNPDSKAIQQIEFV